MPLPDSKVERKPIKLNKDQIQYKTSGYKLCPKCNKEYFSINLAKCLMCKYTIKVEES